MHVTCLLVHLGLVEPECWVCDRRLCPSSPTRDVGRVVLARLKADVLWGLLAGVAIVAVLTAAYRVSH